MSENKITGGCLCGAVRFEVSEPPVAVGPCHCRMCQRHTGSAFFTAARFRENALAWTRGKPTVYRSSKILQRGFCSKCGSTLYIYYPDPPWQEYEKGTIGVALGTLDDPYPWTPQFHYAVESKLHWTANDDGIPGERLDTDEELKAVYVSPT